MRGPGTRASSARGASVWSERGLTGVEGHEDERVRREVPRGAPVEEAVGVEFVRYVDVSAVLWWADTYVSPSGPQRSFLRCIMKTEYRILQVLW